MMTRIQRMKDLREDLAELLTIRRKEGWEGNAQYQLGQAYIALRVHGDMEEAARWLDMARDSHREDGRIADLIAYHYPKGGSK